MKNWLNEITQQELIDHLEDDDFFVQYGNPVIVHGENGQDVVCMSYELYLRMEQEKDRLERKIEKMIGAMNEDENEAKRREFHDHVEIVEYDPEWPIRFEKEKTAIKNAMGTLIGPIEICHVGGTSIPGMASKPIIDILVLTEKAQIDSVATILETKCGYYYFGECGRRGRIFMSKGDSAENACYLHLTTAENKVARDQLTFKSILMRDPEKAKEYADVKREAAEKYPWSRMDYQKAKRPFIESVLQERSEEMGETER